MDYKKPLTPEERELVMKFQKDVQEVIKKFANLSSTIKIKNMVFVSAVVCCHENFNKEEWMTLCADAFDRNFDLYTRSLENRQK
ncbi:MAG TPA: hypothetical protein VIJ14_10405 [Rhabdochlamydiaceae bacterium]